VALLYGVSCGGVLFVLSDVLCMRLYQSRLAGQYLAAYALLVPMLYADAIIDAINKGLGLQKTCVRNNIFTAALDVLGLYLLLPRWGMQGYFISFFLTHLINAGLSLGLLLKHTGVRIRIHIPISTLAAMLGACHLAASFLNPAAKVSVFLLLAYSALAFCGVIHKEDLRWLLGLVRFEKNPNIL
jgi:O-antigen/teichoic acid export membrane protein